MLIASNHILPYAVGIVAVIVGAVAVNYFLNKKSKKRPTSNNDQSKPLPNDVPETPTNDTKQKRTLVDPSEKYMLPLVEKESISHDTCLFRFGLPSKEHILGLPTGQHIHLIATINEELVIRAYTPVTSDADLGCVDLVIKVYRRGVHPKFPEGGKMSQYLDSLNIGDRIAFRGPTGKLQYQGNGQFSIKKMRKDPPTILNVDYVNMIAGGTGITPMLQLSREVLKFSNDKTKLSLVFANQSEGDILLRKELEELAAQHPDQFKVWYTVDTATEEWTYSKGFVNEEMLRNQLYPPSDRTLVLMCGPPPMINYACQPNLEKLGHISDLRFAY